MKYLQEHGVRIWNEWADANGDLGHIYGYQWRSWPDYNGGFIDQISETVETIKHNPDSRRIIAVSYTHLVTTWHKTRLSKRIQILLLSEICPVSPRGCIELLTIYFMIIFAAAKKQQTLTPEK